jgi:hypothetical protein
VGILNNRLAATSGWPTAELNPIARLRVLAAGLPGVWVEERVIDAAFDRVWEFAADLEVSAPAFDTDVAELRVVERDDDRLTARVRGARRFLGLSWWVEAELRSGWCWMVTRPQFYVVGMAAEPAGTATRFAHLEGVNVTGSAALVALARPLHTASRWRHRRHVPHDVDELERIVTTTP